MIAEPTLILITLSGLRLGSCVHTPDLGWRFLSGVSAHKNSRKYWPTAEACIPRWARRDDGALITAAEWRRISQEDAA